MEGQIGELELDLAAGGEIEQELSERDVKLFYVELTGVVRRYIERTTGIHAPEQTTEEFLNEIGARSDFPLVESRRLQQFLQSADLVKFARFKPTQDDAETHLRTAETLVEQTRPLPTPQEGV